MGGRQKKVDTELGEGGGRDGDCNMACGRSECRARSRRPGARRQAGGVVGRGGPIQETFIGSIRHARAFHAHCKDNRSVSVPSVQLG